MVHSKFFIGMLDQALGMVETKNVGENIKTLAEMHVEYGVEEEYFVILGKALVDTLLEETLQSDWNDEIRAACHDVYGKLSSQMISALKGESTQHS
jgi:hemoglobin-like flavoprotein